MLLCCLWHIAVVLDSCVCNEIKSYVTIDSSAVNYYNVTNLRRNFYPSEFCFSKSRSLREFAQSSGIVFLQSGLKRRGDTIEGIVRLQKIRMVMFIYRIRYFSLLVD